MDNVPYLNNVLIFEEVKTWKRQWIVVRVRDITAAFAFV